MKESSSNEKQKNGGNSDALFPRLHVKETRNNAPRAPPRNKMALYEQFTIPSQRFQQTAQSQQHQEHHHQQQQQIAQSFIPQSFAGGYYMPYYMTTPMAFQPMNMMMGQQFLPNQTNFDVECDQVEKQDSALKLESEPSNLEAQAVLEVPASGSSRCCSPFFVADVYQSPSNSIESNEGNGRPTRPSLQEEAETEDSETSVLENSAVPHVSSKDITFAVGDEHIWKMRKSMQRQQNIFQKQLFELHGLTKVQQLMAAAGLRDPEENQRQITPSNPINE